jgi:hypothetical protein
VVDRRPSGHHEPVDDAEPGPPRVRPEDMRAGDADREQVLERLRAANAEGRLDLDEFDERVTATLVARTYGELAALTVDLPGEPPSPDTVVALPPAAPPALREPAGQQPRDLHAAASAWAGVSVTTVAIWAVGCIATASFIHPWWLWVVGPWGAVLLVSWIQVRRHHR